MEKSIPRYHWLSSLGKPRDANRWSSGRIFLSYPHTHDRFLYYCTLLWIFTVPSYGFLLYPFMDFYCIHLWIFTVPSHGFPYRMWRRFLGRFLSKDLSMWPVWFMRWRNWWMHLPCWYVLYIKQGSHRLEKYLNLEGFLEKSLKIKSTLKSTGKSLKSLEKSLNSTIFCRTTHCR